MNDKYKQYLLSDEWAQLKIDLYASRGRVCEKCGSKKKLQVHHKHYRNIFREEPADLIILCEICHLKEHKIKNDKYKKSNSQRALYKSKHKSLSGKVWKRKMEAKRKGRFIKKFKQSPHSRSGLKM